MFVVKYMEQDAGDQSKRSLTDVGEFAENPMLAFSQMSRTLEELITIPWEPNYYYYINRIEGIKLYKYVDISSTWNHLNPIIFISWTTHSICNSCKFLISLSSFSFWQQLNEKEFKTITSNWGYAWFQNGSPAYVCVWWMLDAPCWSGWNYSRPQNQSILSIPIILFI